MTQLHLPQGGLVSLHIQLWSFPKSHIPLWFLMRLSLCQNSLLKCGYIQIYYTLSVLVKALLSLQQIIANHTLYFWPCLRCTDTHVPCSLVSLITLLSHTACIPFLMCVETRWFFIFISKIQISSDEIKAQLVRR